MKSTDALLFKVVEGAHEYKIYASGEIEGFADGALIVNYLDAHLATAIQEHGYRLQPSSCDSLSPDATAERTEQPCEIR